MEIKKRFFNILIFIILSFSLIVSIAGCGGKANHSISGSVTGATYAYVIINMTGATTASGMTDANGYFVFTERANGTYTLTPVMEGYTFNPPSIEKVVHDADITDAYFVAEIPTYVVVPEATFIQGLPPSASGNSEALVVKSAAPSGPLYINSSVTWTVTWKVTKTPVVNVDMYFPEMDGYFEYEVEPEEAAVGEAQFDMAVSSEPPVEERCTRCDYYPNPNVWQTPGCTCYVKAPESTTDSLEASVTLVGDGVDVGVPVGGVGLTWSLCGNGACDAGEDSNTCLSDCPICGNGLCEIGENPSICPNDCPVCGNGFCESGENSSTCRSDCSECGTGPCVSGGNSITGPGSNNPVLPNDFPADIPLGSYSMSCNGQTGRSFSNTSIEKFAQELKSNLESMNAQFTAQCTSGCTCDTNLTFSDWNGSSFTMTEAITLTCCAGGQCVTVPTSVTCIVTSN